MSTRSLPATKIKLCGMMREEDIKAANECMPDYIGFIFWEKSFRNLSFSQAEELKAILNPDIKAVGVFVNPDMSVVISLFQRGIIDVAQLHGSETEEDIECLHAAGIPVIKAFVMPKEDNPHTSEVKAVLKRAYECCADYVLFDAGKGYGMSFNWELLKEFKRDFFLAGGLSPENVAEAISTVHPYAVDVSSGIETDKHKSSEKMYDFCINARL